MQAEKSDRIHGDSFLIAFFPARHIHTRCFPLHICIGQQCEHAVAARCDILAFRAVPGRKNVIQRGSTTIVRKDSPVDLRAGGCRELCVRPYTHRRNQDIERNVLAAFQFCGIPAERGNTVRKIKPDAVPFDVLFHHMGALFIQNAGQNTIRQINDCNFFHFSGNSLRAFQPN